VLTPASCYAQVHSGQLSVSRGGTPERPLLHMDLPIREPTDPIPTGIAAESDVVTVRRLGHCIAAHHVFSCIGTDTVLTILRCWHKGCAAACTHACMPACEQSSLQLCLLADVTMTPSQGSAKN